MNCYLAGDFECASVFLKFDICDAIEFASELNIRAMCTDRQAHQIISYYEFVGKPVQERKKRISIKIKSLKEKNKEKNKLFEK
jgi:hypothetical protein